MVEHLVGVNHDIITDFLQGERLVAHHLWALVQGLVSDFFTMDYRVYDADIGGKIKNDRFREMILRATANKRVQARTVTIRLLICQC